MIGLFLVSAQGMNITGYTAAKNNRFSSGFPTSPVPNTDATFIGLGRDWSGVAWSTQTHAASSYKGLAMLSPLHFLTAQHYEYANNSEATTGVRVLGKDGLVKSVSGVSSISNLGHGLSLTNYVNTNYDLAIGTLQQPVTSPSNIFRNAVLDLNISSTSNTLSNYSSLPLLLYGRGSTTNQSPRVGAAMPDLVAAFNSDANQVAIRTTRSAVQLEAGDSGSPALHAWSNPNGEIELTVLGVNSAIDTTDGYNFISFLPTAGAMNAANAAMTPLGHALRVVGNPFATWNGGSGPPNQRDDLSRNGNWSSTNLPGDLFVLFDAAQTNYPAIDVNLSTSLRGLYFKSTAATNDAFTFSGSSTLTIGRGGITNYDNDVQTFSANLTLGDHQYWDAGPGGLSVANINTNGKLLEIRAPGSSTISGNVSGTGSLALESGSLHLPGSSTFSGITWLHEGTLRVTGSIASSASVRLGITGILSGSGIVSAVQGAGTISPGTGPAILTCPSLAPIGGLDFAFEFTTASPDFTMPASAGNDVMRLTGATPFASAMGAVNRVAVYLDVPALETGQQFRGGFFTNQSADFYASIQNAIWEVHVSDAGGPIVFGGKTYSSYTGPRPITVSTEAHTVGMVNGRILQLAVGADPTTYEGWSLTAFPEEIPEASRLPNADPNEDGITNLLAYALRLDPMTTPLDKLPQQFLESGEDPVEELVFRFRRSKIASDLTYQVRVSGDLVSWSILEQVPGVVDPDLDDDGGTELVEVRMPVTAEEMRKFVRLRVFLSE